jgi:hypothetical protein
MYSHGIAHLPLGGRDRRASCRPPVPPCDDDDDSDGQDDEDDDDDENFQSVQDDDDDYAGYPSGSQDDDDYLSDDDPFNGTLNGTQAEEKKSDVPEQDEEEEILEKLTARMSLGEASGITSIAASGTTVMHSDSREYSSLQFIIGTARSTINRTYK